MDWLYRIFYTVFSMSGLMVLLFPIVAAVRFLLRNFRKKYTEWAWCILFLRSIFPVALSSALCLVPEWNRSYHLFLSRLGLEIQDNAGIMRSWLAVFKNNIQVSAAFKMCSVIWAIGALGSLIFAVINTHKLKKDMKSAVGLGENIYETDKLSVPMQLGLLHRNLYLPKGFQAKDMVWLLRHMESHRADGIKHILIMPVMAAHWFNPVMWLYHYWWSLDLEMAADDKTICKSSSLEQKEYAQGLMNFKKDAKRNDKNSGITGGPFFGGIKEKNMEKRAYRIMYLYGNTARARLSAYLILSLVMIGCFLLRPMQIAWSGGTWGNDKKAQSESFLQNKKANVIAKMKTNTPEGLDRVIQVEMLNGTESEKGYQGNFVLKMYDAMENEVASRKLENIFPKLQKGKQYFSKGVTLCISDYNGDDTQELVIGQMAGETSKEYVTFSYTLIEIGDKSLNVVCSDIMAVDVKERLSESVAFEKIEGIEDIFIVPNGEKKEYYVWDGGKDTYEKRAMTEEDLEAHKKSADSGAAGEKQEHTLENTDGKTMVLVATQRDSTQSEEIQSVILEPRGTSKKYENIRGYYCDLLWVASGEEKERFAKLIYNGTKAQTFVLYDTKNKRVYYQHEDGTNQLRDVFKQYKETEITFEKGGAVVYDLAEKKGDVLTISYAAEADGGITVKGSYDYNVQKKEASNLSFERSEISDT